MNELTDLEICQRIAEIEGLRDTIESAIKNISRRQYKSIFATGVITSQQTFEDVYNPLTDDALCFKLMVKYKVSLLQSKGVCCGRILGGYSTAFRFDSPNRAICLAIIESKE
jgi:hypothetical protein